MTKELITYQSNDGKISFNVNVFEETVWLTQKQMGELFDKERSVITKHIKNVFDEGELEQKSNVQKVHIANSDKPVELYNLDVIISVGYRVKSKRGTQFRKWATSVLKQYMISGYALNEQRIKSIEDNLDKLSTELRAEIRKVHDAMLRIANRPITINNQIRIGSTELENKIIQLLDEIIKSSSNQNTKAQIYEIKEEVIKSPKNKQAKNKIFNFFQEIGDSNSDLHKTIKGAGISGKIIKELIKLGEKLKDFIS